MFGCSEQVTPSGVLPIAEEWRIEPSGVRIGEAEGRPEYELNRVQRPIFTTDSTVAFVHDYGEVRFYTTAGRYQKTFGRRGGGPHEFAQLLGVYNYNDTLIAIDPPRRRAVVLSASGEFIRSFELVSQSVDPFAGLAFFRVDEFAGALNGPMPAVTKPTAVRLSATLVLQRKGKQEELLAVPGPARMALPGGYNGRPLTEQTRIAPWKGRMVLADPESAFIRIATTNGEVERTIRLPAATRRVTDETIEGLKAAIKVEARRAGVPEQIFAVPSYATYPEQLPYWGRLFASHNECIWIRRYWAPGETYYEWLILDPMSNRLASLRVPVDLHISDVRNDLAVALERDELDVQHLAFYRIVRPDGSSHCKAR